MQIEFTISTTEGTSLFKTRHQFTGAFQDARAKAMEMLSGKSGVSITLNHTCYFLAFSNGEIAIDQ